MKFRKALLAICASLGVMAQPLVAQAEEQDAADAAAMEALQGMFEVEPLTAEQEARVPLASGVVEKMLPAGALDEMVDTMFGNMLGPMVELASSNPQGEVTSLLGLEGREIELTEDEAVELADMLDPQWRERNRIAAGVLPRVMSEIMSKMEPTIRKAMAEVFAVNFNETELKDIDAFFSTPSGASFARNNLKIAGDPRLLSASMEMLPEMMASFGEMETLIEAETAKLAAPRSWDELDREDRARIAELTGLDESEIRANMEMDASADEPAADDSAMLEDSE